MMATSRGVSASLLSKASTASCARISVPSGHAQLCARRRFDFKRSQVEWSSTMVGGVHRPVVRQEAFFGWPVPGLSKNCAVARPYPEGLQIEGDDECDSEEEVVDGCRVRHGELWNGDVRIHYVECGDMDGELVVLIHGFPNFWYVWKNQFPALVEAGYHVVAPDLRGYNSSSKPTSIQDYGRHSVVSDVALLIDELGDGKPATVVGHDWGGFVTWAVAEDFPEKLKKIVIVNVPHFSVFSAALRSSFRQIRRSWYIGLFQLPWLPEWFMVGRDFKNLKVILSTSAFQPQDMDRHVRAFQKEGAITGAINYYRASVRGYWSTARSPIPVELPVVLIWGELDAFLGEELAVIPNTIASNAVINFLPHCSHWPMWDDPEQFNALLLESVHSHHATSADRNSSSE